MKSQVEFKKDKMSAVLLSSGTKKETAKRPTKILPPNETAIKVSQSQSDMQSALETPQEEDRNDEEAREERKATGRSVAIFIFLSLMCLALYHIVQKKTTILAGVSFKNASGKCTQFPPNKFSFRFWYLP